ncbi:YceI family protein [Marinobacterium mangrovicola]|uniref:Polyisoprenoid-binding protein YceI n=1 Tax=Marinobacterium mangrovicola TaxID=1476959 RepID=A0A4R1GNB4_9GAMM|nr:YceI family protein [Marinobacterium mangrovicola]TCK08723.1 polyisoprenoid-binding protein YceI [Marinobacterium mangrovicola]
MKMTALKGAALAGFLAFAPSAFAADYAVDTQGMHASVNFRISHLGFSWLKGRFNDFDGSFSYDAENPADSSVSMEIDTASLTTNHAERDKHIRSDDFLNVDEYPTATFQSTSFAPNDDGTAVLTGDLTLHGVTNEVTVDVTKIGEGEDPWGGYRAGFSGTLEFQPADFGIEYNLGPASETVYLDIELEGVRQ